MGLLKQTLQSNVALAALSGVLYFLGFAGFDLWPLALIAYVPMLFALQRLRLEAHWTAIKLGLVFGFIAMFGGYYWLIHVLREFSGFPLALCILFASVLVLQQAGAFGVFAWLWHLAHKRGLSPTLALVISATTAEFAYPMLFPYYYGASFHNVPILLQTAELGGPLLVSVLCFLINGTIFELWQVRKSPSRLAWRKIAISSGLVFLALAYGLVRIDQVDRRVSVAPKINVGLVQANMDTLGKRDDPVEGLHRHIRLSQELEFKHNLDLLIWPESAYAWAIPQELSNVRRAVMGPLKTPLLFGAISRRSGKPLPRVYNTAFITDAHGNLKGNYDKTYLLAFGEYLPFGDIFPVLYEWSPRSGRFMRGEHVNALPLGRWHVGTLICYEDILPAFVRKLINQSNPHFLVNITNDAWFGNTTEPWEHLALAKLRAVEHRRFLVRATNSGVSAIVDPVGRLVSRTDVFRQQSLFGEIAMLQGRSLYAFVGDWPGWLALLLSLWLIATWLRPILKQRSKQ